MQSRGCAAQGERQNLSHELQQRSQTSRSQPGQDSKRTAVRLGSSCQQLCRISKRPAPGRRVPFAADPGGGAVRPIRSNSTSSSSARLQRHRISAAVREPGAGGACLPALRLVGPYAGGRAGRWPGSVRLHKQASASEATGARNPAGAQVPRQAAAKRMAHERFCGQGRLAQAFLRLRAHRREGGHGPRNFKCRTADPEGQRRRQAGRMEEPARSGRPARGEAEHAIARDRGERRHTRERYK